MLGKLPAEALESIAEHVDGCRTCDSTLTAMDGLTDPLVERLQGTRDSELPPPESELRRLMAMADGIVPEVSSSSGETPAETFSRLGNYELLEQLGKGGMGTVYKANHVRLKRIVAVKLLAPHRLGDPHAVPRFLREMEAVGKLDHPNIVRALDAGEADGNYYLAMELIEGADLKNLVRCHGPLAVADACELVCQAATAVQYAHAGGLLHRDIKPSNLMVTPAGQVKVLDLGLARLQMVDSATADDLTAQGQVLGTADYIAPEQGLDSREADARSDVYSLGCTLYFLLAGQPPFNDPEEDTFAKRVLAHVRSPVVPISEFRDDVPPPLVAALDRALAKAPDDRFATAGELADALLPFAAGSDLPRLIEKPIASPPSSELALSAIESEAPPRRRWVGLALLAALIIIGGVFAAWAVRVRITQKDGTTTVVDHPGARNVSVDIDVYEEKKPDKGSGTETPAGDTGARRRLPDSQTDEPAPDRRQGEANEPIPEMSFFDPSPKALKPGESPPRVSEGAGRVTRRTVIRSERHEIVSHFAPRRPDPTVPVLWSKAAGGNGHYYQRVDQHATWANAKALAESMTFQGMKGHLVTITTPQENLFVSNRVLGISTIWIGLSRKTDETAPTSESRNKPKPGEWVWVTGEPADYTSWGRETGRGDFVYMYSGGCWIDGGVFGMPFVVEFAPGNSSTTAEPAQEESPKRNEQKPSEKGGDR